MLGHEEEVPSRDRAREMLLMGLRLTEGVDEARFAARAGMALRIALKVVDVREATDTEISEGSVGESPLQVLHGAPPDAPLH